MSEIDTSAEALLKLADRLCADDAPLGIDATDPDAVDKVLAATDALFSDIDRTLRAIATERSAPAADVVERVARAIGKNHHQILSDGRWVDWSGRHYATRAAIAAVYPLIRAKVIEECAQIVDRVHEPLNSRRAEAAVIASAIRQLKDTTP